MGQSYVTFIYVIRRSDNIFMDHNVFYINIEVKYKKQSNN